MEIAKKVRNPLFDIVKALMMVWVIWGHLGLYMIVPPYSCSVPYMTNAKIGMNMPVFFMISGFLAVSTFTRSPGSKIIARSIGFMWPQIVYALCWATLLWALKGVSFSGVYNHVMCFWFLHCLFIIYLLSGVIYRLLPTDKTRIAGFAAAYVALLFWPSRFNLPWMGQVIHMFPYFVFGLMILPRWKLYRNNIVGALCGLAFLAVVFLEGNSDINGMNFWKVTAHWRVVFFHGRDLITFFARTFVGITGSIFCLWLVDRVIALLPQVGKLATFGTTSLGVYVIHEYIILLLGRHTWGGGGTAIPRMVPLACCDRLFPNLPLYHCRNQVQHLYQNDLLWQREVAVRETFGFMEFS